MTFERGRISLPEEWAFKCVIQYEMISSKNVYIQATRDELSRLYLRVYVYGTIIKGKDAINFKRGSDTG